MAISEGGGGVGGWGWGDIAWRISLGNSLQILTSDWREGEYVFMNNSCISLGELKESNQYMHYKGIC